ncbi:SelT/SelW/SelH family protein [Saccharothrix sp. Mg75]|uniref:SelT/SelW/SelH family protein n=1 Tax=Saccharothrix sp. Mg75 TaxID=3445357 RepID=UPI003EE89618
MTTRRPRVEVEYCTQCRWLLRAGWTAQELLTTFTTELGEVALVPGTGGVFDVRLDGELLWSRKAEGGFPEMAALKQLVRDRVAPGRDLGHSDRKAAGREAAGPEVTGSEGGA